MVFQYQPMYSMWLCSIVKFVTERSLPSLNTSKLLCSQTSIWAVYFKYLNSTVDVAQRFV